MTASTTTPITSVVDDVLDVLEGEGYGISPGIHDDQASARTARADDGPLIGYTDGQMSTRTLRLFHDLSEARGERAVQALEDAGLNVDWDGSPDLLITVSLPVD